MTTCGPPTRTTTTTTRTTTTALQLFNMNNNNCPSTRSTTTTTTSTTTTFDSPSTVTTDACTNKQTIGAALQQDDRDGFQPVVFYSLKLKDAELNYNTREKELLAIKEALSVWRHFLIGS
eukprot:2599717-Rhodomonas_salina.2